MKKIWALILAAALMLFMTACAESQDSSGTQDSSKDVQVLDWASAYDEYLENAARAEQNYDGKLVQWTATVTRINENSCEMTNEWHNGLPLNAIDVYMSKDDLASLNRGQEITIIGTMDIGSFTYILDAYIVENESEQLLQFMCGSIHLLK